MKNNATLFAFLAMTSSLICSGCGSTTTGTTQTQTPPNPVQTTNHAPQIREVIGTTYIKRGTTLTRATPGLALTKDDVIETSPTGTADILWPAYGHTLIATSSIVSLTAAQDDTQNIVVKLTLEAGRIWTRLQRLLETKSSFEIQSKDIVSTVRGTSFGVKLLPMSVNVQVKESKVGVARVTDQQEVSVTAGQETDAPMATGTIATPRPLSPEELQDPFIIQGDQIVPANELEGSTNSSAATQISTQSVDAIEYQGHQIPLTELYIGTGPDCDAAHYHAKTGIVTTIDGTLIPDPENCGYGHVKDQPTITFKIQ